MHMLCHFMVHHCSVSSMRDTASALLGSHMLFYALLAWIRYVVCSVLCVLLCAMLCCAVLVWYGAVLMCCVMCCAVCHAVLQSNNSMCCCQCRQRVTVIPHLISYCNSCLQALLPQHTPSPVCHMSSSSWQLTKPPTPHDSPPAQAASDKAASSAAVPQADLALYSAQADACPGGESLKASEAVADVPVEEVKGAVLRRPGLEGPALEGPLGQALAEATVETILAVLRNSEDAGRPSAQTPVTMSTLHAMHQAWIEGLAGAQQWV